ncbi:B12-binding domain-containing radical SAM protein [Paludibacter jiangxiensis]|uniref:Radical SAM superfamily protein n=1 Tax=Paludibacter jiangxiensis TaxID=681398 RepID=A0A170ZFK7_9BACT|nr:radical SAM protein [Paludibacter jiangxiensis]GAT62621.1 radical SAM superfamily protein [Paludibacter jiangxiensis]
MKILLVTPPLTQLNTPYPATCHLQGFLRSRGIDAGQMDLSIELIEHLFTREQLSRIFQADFSGRKLSRQSKNILEQYGFYIQTIEPVMRFLSGRDSSLAQRFSDLDFWPQSKRFPSEDDLEWAFGVIGNHDRATHLCTLFLKDLCDFINQNLDPNFELIRYAESLCLRLPEFVSLQQTLQQPPSLIDQLMLDVFAQKIRACNPEMVGFCIPFPGNLYAGLRCAQWLRKEFPSVKIVMGGGYVNTELRSITDPTIFDYIDYLTFDDGELPLLRLIEGGEMVRTLYRNGAGEIVRANADSKENIPFTETAAPDYDGLLHNNYINLIELTNPMHALWSNGRWNKMMLAHGCYWGKCTFCDGSLDYIQRFEMAPVELIVDRMEAVMQQTGQSGFHFVDEAAPPALLRKLSEEILRRKLTVSYWTNVRFEKSYTPELCYLMAKSGCIAISGGLEVASPRILKMINKGITIETARESMKNFANAGIMTHAYLMYGFPTETAQETVDSLEVVRDLFANGWLQSAFWHRYAMTAHSPSGLNPESVGAKHVSISAGTFANNEIPFTTPHEIDLDYYGEGLNLATYNYMQGAGFDMPIKKWFVRK